MTRDTGDGLPGWTSSSFEYAFAYLALALGAILQALGLVGLFGVLQPVIDVLLIVQGLWFLAAAVTLLVRPMPASAQASTTRPAA
jgi:hypothetical protein